MVDAPAIAHRYSIGNHKKKCLYGYVKALFYYLCNSYRTCFCNNIVFHENFLYQRSSRASFYG